MSDASLPVGDGSYSTWPFDDGDVAVQREAAILERERAVAVDDEPQVRAVRDAKALGLPRHARRRAFALAGQRDQSGRVERAVAAGEMRLVERDARRREMRAQSAVADVHAVLRRVELQRVARDRARPQRMADGPAAPRRRDARGR